MTTISVAEDQLHLELSQWERVGAFHGDISVPTNSIVSVERLENARSSIRGLRAPGTGWPGRIALGTWRTRKTKDFVAVYRNESGYVVELEGQQFDRLIFSSPPIAELETLAV